MSTSDGTYGGESTSYLQSISACTACLTLHSHRQFGAVNGELLAVSFPVVDAQGDVIAAVEKDFTGLAREVRRANCRYCIHTGVCPRSLLSVPITTPSHSPFSLRHIPQAPTLLYRHNALPIDMGEGVVVGGGGGGRV